MTEETNQRHFQSQVQILSGKINIRNSIGGKTYEPTAPMDAYFASEGLSAKDVIGLAYPQQLRAAEYSIGKDKPPVKDWSEELKRLRSVRQGYYQEHFMNKDDESEIDYTHIRHGVIIKGEQEAGEFQPSPPKAPRGSDNDISMRVIH